MRQPGQLGDGDRKIPIAETSRQRMGNALYEQLTQIRREEGIDPKRYPPVAADIQYDIRRTMIGAEITARETADLILPAIRSTPGLATNPSGSGWAIKALLFLIVVLGITTTILAGLGYQEILNANNRKKISLSRIDYLGRALLTNPNFTIKTEGSDFVIIPTDDIMSDPIRVPHNIPPEELKRLEPK
jgi:hypothetical protein